MSLGHRVAVMQGGVLQRISSPRDAYALPVNVFVAAFIGTPRISLLQAVVHAPLDAGMSLDLGGQRLALPEPLNMVHVNTGSRPAVVADLEAARPPAAPGHRRRPRGNSLGSLGRRVMSRLSGSVATLGSPPPQSPAGEAGVDPDRSDLVVRTGPQVRVRAGAQILLLVDLGQRRRRLRPHVTQGR
jgi:multiple sugar transport system ATP-binding protein